MAYKDSTYLDNIKQFEMTGDHRKLLERMMGWYWSVAKQRELITLEDYNFLYEIWNNGVTSYSKKMQERLNRIRQLYTETEL
jgi:hypothetical protein